MTYKIGVFGNGDGELDGKISQKARDIGYLIALHGQLITGACGGYPGEAWKGTIEAGGRAFCFSPAKDREEHITKYSLPDLENQGGTVFYTNTNFTLRDFLNVTTVDACIIIGGKTGTLHELSLAMELGKIIGVLKGSGGLSEGVNRIDKLVKKPDSTYDLILESDPQKLIKKIIEKINERTDKEKTKKWLKNCYSIDIGLFDYNDDGKLICKYETE